MHPACSEYTAVKFRGCETYCGSDICNPENDGFAEYEYKGVFSPFFFHLFSVNDIRSGSKIHFYYQLNFVGIKYWYIFFPIPNAAFSVAFLGNFGLFFNSDSECFATKERFGFRFHDEVISFLAYVSCWFCDRRKIFWQIFKICDDFVDFFTRSFYFVIAFEMNEFWFHVAWNWSAWVGGVKLSRGWYYFNLITADLLVPYFCFIHLRASSRIRLPWSLSGAITRSVDQVDLEFFFVLSNRIISTSAGRFFFVVKLPKRWIDEIGTIFSIFLISSREFFQSSFR